MQNIGDELLNGPRSDRTLQMLHDSAASGRRPAVGPARAAVRVAIGSQEYDQIRSSVATEATQFAPAAFNDASSTGARRARSTRSSPTQMRKMSPDDFVEMLRSAIKQDEWLLFVHGGALGLFAGFLHLAIFGV